MNKNSEEEFREEFCKYYSKNNKKELYKEVPVFSRSVDLVEYDTRKHKITAIEFKVKDWKRAIKQLLEVMSCFDYLVLCIPKPKTITCLDRIKKECVGNGIGLITWNPDSNTFYRECNPKNVRAVWNVQKKQIINYLKIQK